MKILGTGLNGLVGSRIVELLQNTYEFENLSRSEGVDITNNTQVLQKITTSDATYVIHCAAKTNVDACEADKQWGEQSDAYKTNVLGTQNIVRACQETGKKLIYISTDFVFDGEKDFYTEDDIPNPINYYGLTKYLGEREVQKLTTPWIILRLAYPYRASFEKKDFLRVIVDRLKTGQKIIAITDHIFTPTFIDDVSFSIDALMRNEANGVYHVVGAESLSPYDAAMAIAKEFHLDSSLIERTTRALYFAEKATRPFHLVLKNDKITTLGVSMKTFHEGLEAVKKQQENI